MYILMYIHIYVSIDMYVHMQVICRFGSPNILITDQGREFVNDLTAELYSITIGLPVPIILR